ncbi:hypothetical protein A1OW_17770 [Enterovibrio norvegicus]|uniref:sensor histidine kinase n=1 Tax=Enterovibrio norvegicus TaxID=188144 RepID=UPI0003184064|nr:sensor histidine kinase [Enterovibrio norvegicus]OEF63829.1 hypothetical protein A1OW_17770 [Enterovibrio norvegicus]
MWGLIRRGVLLGTTLLALFFSVQVFSGQVLSAQGLAQGTSLNGQWQFIQSHTLLSPQDLSKVQAWRTVKVPSLLNTNPTNGLYGNYRIRFNAPMRITHSERPQTLYIAGIRHNDRVYLNGERIGQVGRFTKNWQIILDNPNNLPRAYPLPNALLKPTNNELIIQIQLGFGQAWGAMLPGGVGISGNVEIIDEHTATKQYTQAVTTIHIIDSIIILLGIVDLALIVLLFKSTLHKFPEFIWLLLGSGLLFCGSLLLDIGHLQGITNDATKLTLLLCILFTPLVNAIFFNVQQRLATPAMLWSVTFGVTVCAFLLLTPFIPKEIKPAAWLVWSALTALLFIFSLVCAGLSIKQKRVGSITIFLGLCMYILSINTRWLPFEGLYNRNLVIGSLFFRYALVWAYFLKIKDISVHYQRLTRQMLSRLEEQKKSTARDIHDELGQYLSSAKLHLQLSEKTGQPQHQTLLKSELQNAIVSMRRIIEGLHPVVLEKRSLKEAIDMDADRLTKRNQICIEADVADMTVSLSNAAHIYRLVQELLGNITKHSQAKCAWVSIRQNKRSIIIRVEDDGIGVDHHSVASMSEGFGHVSLHERVQLLGGNIEYGIPKSRQGTFVNITLPIASD